MFYTHRKLNLPGYVIFVSTSEMSTNTTFRLDLVWTLSILSEWQRAHNTSKYKGIR